MFKKRSFCFFKILKNRTGFTTIELAVTLGLLGILTAIAVPSYISYLPRHRLQTSVRQIYDDMQLAKIRAVKDNGVAVVKFTPSTSSYTIFLDASVPLNWALDAGETIIKQNVSLENGVSITGTTLAGHTCGFNNRGMLPSPAVPGVVQLTNPTGLLMGVDVNAAGGISIVTSTDGWATWS